MPRLFQLTKSAVTHFRPFDRSLSRNTGKYARLTKLQHVGSSRKSVVRINRAHPSSRLISFKGFQEQPDSATKFQFRSPTPPPNTVLPSNATTKLSAASPRVVPPNPESSPSWRRLLVRCQNFLSDPDRPVSQPTDSRFLKLGKFFVRRMLFPYRFVFKTSRRVWIKISSLGKWAIPSLCFVLASIFGLTFFVIKILMRANLSMSRELFIRSTLIDLTARLSDYGILDKNVYWPILERFRVVTTKADIENAAEFKMDIKTKALRGESMMKLFLQQAMSAPVDTAQTLADMYDPESRIDDVSELVEGHLFEFLSSMDPKSIIDSCPPHILAVAQQYVQTWLLKTREQMIVEKERKALEMLEARTGIPVKQYELIDPKLAGSPASLNSILRMARQLPNMQPGVIESIAEELSTGQMFDISLQDRRSLFWKGIFQGVMLESNLVGLENETTFLRLGREMALKGCILRNIPQLVKTQISQQESSHPFKDVIIDNPSQTFSFNTQDDLIAIRDNLTQLPFNQNHGQIDLRFLEFLFGAEFANEYNISPDLFPYLHQIAPLVLLDVASWTHPSSIFSLTNESAPRLLQGSKYTVSPGEFEKVEMFNFMMDEIVKKDRAFAFREKQYQHNAVSRDELLVLPLLQPQDSLRHPRKYGLDQYESQLEMLRGTIPACYKDTYGAFANSIFMFDCILLRNYIEIHRIRSLLSGFATQAVNAALHKQKQLEARKFSPGDTIIPEANILDILADKADPLDLSNDRPVKVQLDIPQYRPAELEIPESTLQLLSYQVHDVHIPNRDNYYGLYDRILDQDLLDVIKHEQRTTESYRRRGLKYRPEYLPGSVSDEQQLDVESLSSIETQRRITQTTIDEQLRKTSHELHTVSADAELFKELHVKPNRMVELSPAGISQLQDDQNRRQRIEKWRDNNSV